MKSWIFADPAFEAQSCVQPSLLSVISCWTSPRCNSAWRKLNPERRRTHMSVPTLTDLGRRVVAHLPVWTSDEKALVEAEGGPDVSIRSYALAEFAERLGEDASTPTLSEAEVLVSLKALSDAGLAKEVSGKWKMTKLGYEALVAPVEEQPQAPGEVVVGLNPAEADASAIGG
jgi:hypothetical protein